MSPNPVRILVMGPRTAAGEKLQGLPNGDSAFVNLTWRKGEAAKLFSRQKVIKSEESRQWESGERAKSRELGTQSLVAREL